MTAANSPDDQEEKNLKGQIESIRQKSYAVSENVAQLVDLAGMIESQVNEILTLIDEYKQSNEKKSGETKP